VKAFVRFQVPVSYVFYVAELVRYFYPTMAEKVESDKWTAIDGEAASDITFEFKTATSNAIVRLKW